MELMVYKKQEVLDMFGITNNTLDSWETQGYIQRMNIPGKPRYSKSSIETLLYDGTDNLIIKKDREIRELKAQILEYRSIIEKVNGLTSI